MKHKNIFIAQILAIILVLIMPFAAVFADNSSDNANIKIFSESAILVDSNTGKILYNKDGKKRKYPASTTKILTAILAIEHCKLDEEVTVDYESIALVPSGYTVAALQVGEKITVKQLLEVLLVHSANDAANVLAKHVSGSIEKFAKLMNSKAKEIGCKDSNFVNPSGKHENNHYTTAYDLYLIMKYCMKNDTFKSIASQQFCTIPATNKYVQRAFTNNNELIVMDTRDVETNYYYPYVIAGKTGYTSEAKNTLVTVAKKDNLELICVVLGALRTDKGLSARFVDSRTLYDYGFNTYTIRKLREKGAIAQQIEVPNATKDSQNLDLLLTEDINVLIKQKDLKTQIEPEITLNENISAPIRQGERIGKIKYTVEGIEYTSDLVASHSVEKNNLLFFIIQIILIIFILFIVYKLISSKRKNNIF